MSITAIRPAVHSAVDPAVDPAAAPAARPAAPASRPAPGQLRLTRRGRAVIVGGAVSLLLAVGVVLGDGSVATESAGQAPDTRIVSVGPGDTLWGIANEIAAPGDTREVVDEIQRLNALDSAAVMSGQRLRVPVLG